jgi:hypothetical protein
MARIQSGICFSPSVSVQFTDADRICGGRGVCAGLWDGERAFLKESCAKNFILRQPVGFGLYDIEGERGNTPWSSAEECSAR